MVVEQVLPRTVKEQVALIHQLVRLVQLVEDEARVVLDHKHLVPLVVLAAVVLETLLVVAIVIQAVLAMLVDLHQLKVLLEVLEKQQIPHAEVLAVVVLVD